MRSVIAVAAEAPNEVCILDTEASPEHLSRGTARYADAMIAVVEPYYKSLETGRRMARLAKDLGLERVAVVGNKIRDDAEREVVHEFARSNDLEVVGVIPFDETLPAAERARAAPLDFAPDSLAVAAIGALGRELVSGGNGRARSA